MNKLVFIVIHHSSCEKDTNLLINNILSIRDIYPNNKIIIIKTSTSDIPFYIVDKNISIFNKSDDLTFVMGTLPLICTLLDENDKYILIHDSMYLINKLPDTILQNEIYFLWHFIEYFDFPEEDFNSLLSIIDIEYPDILKDLYYNRFSTIWRGCFGPAFGGDIHFLKKVNNILNIEKNMEYFRGRGKLMLSERIFPLIAEYIRTIENNTQYNIIPVDSLNNNIYKQPRAFNKEESIALKNIKSTAIINNYNKYFYKLWFLRN